MCAVEGSKSLGRKVVVPARLSSRQPATQARKREGVIAHCADVVFRLPNPATLDARPCVQRIDDAPPEDVPCDRGRGNGEEKMGIISWIILGVIAGFIGSRIVNKTGQGLIMDIVLGIVGAIVGGVICSQLFGVGVSGLNISSLIVAVVGAVIVLWAYHQFSGRRTL